MWTTNGGVWHGLDSKKADLLYTGDGHITTFGPSGAGKSRRLLLVNLARLLGWSILLVDVKGTLRQLVGDWRRKHGCEELLLNPFNVLNLGSDGYDPITLLDPASDEFADDAMEQAETIITLDGTNEPHWPQSAQELIAAVTMYVRLVIGGSYEDVRALLGQPDAKIREMIKSTKFDYNGKQYPGIIAAGMIHNWREMGHKGARFGDMAPENKELHSIFSTALTQTRWVDSRPIKRDLKGKTFDFGVMKERPVTVYIILPPRRLVTHVKWMRLVVGSCVQALMRDVRPAKVPVLLMLDEYYALAQGGFPIIENNQAMMREYGIKIWSVFQSMAQLHLLFGREGFEAFTGNSGLINSFAPRDLVTAQYVSDMAGQKTAYGLSGSGSRSYSAAQGVSVTEGGGIGQVGVPLILPQDVRKLGKGNTIYFTEQGVGKAYLPDPTELNFMKGVLK